MSFMTVNGTGTGELAISIDTVDDIPIEDAEIDCKSLGSYSVEWDLKAVPDFDYEQPPCEMWLPGTWNVTSLCLQLFAMGSVAANIPIVPSMMRYTS